MPKRWTCLAVALLSLGGGLFAYALNPSNGAPAMDVLGQTDDSLTAPGPVFTNGTANNAPNILGLNTARDLAMDTTNHRLFLSDRSNNRVLVYNLNTNNTLADRIPDAVIGQTDLHSKVRATTQTGMSSATGLAYDATGNRLFVVDSGNSRVLVYNVTTISNGMNASNVLGQSTFTASGAAATQSTLNQSQGLAYDPTTRHLFVSDYLNSRVLVFSGSAISNGMNANTVLGQPDFTTRTAATTQAGLSNPVRLAYDTTRNRLFVGEEGNNRVMVFSGALLGNGMNANTVIGQANFTTATAATTQAGFSIAAGLAIDTAGNRVFVGDFNNSRVLVFSGSALAPGMNANTVLGQSSFTTSTTATTQSGEKNPGGLLYDTTTNRLYVADAGNSRILILSGASLSNGMNANDALGQTDDNLTNPGPVFTKGSANNGPWKLGMNQPFGMAVDTVGHRLFVAEQANNRVTVFNLNADNSLQDRIPDFVIGQSNFYTNTAATTQAGLNGPSGVIYDTATAHLFVGDRANNRVVVFSGASLTNGMNANTVLGQSNFTTATPATTQTGLNQPYSMAYDPTTNRLFIAEANSNRVTVFSGASLTNGMNANTVLGQATFTTKSVTTNQTSINGPRSVAYDTVHRRLFVSEGGGNRITVFSGASLQNGMSGNTVLGQSTFTTATAATTQAGLSFPMHISYDPVADRLFVADTSNHRVLIFNTSNLANGMNATNVLGQVSFTTGSAATSQTGINSPQALTYDSVGRRLYVGEFSNHRITIWPAPVLAGKVFSDEGQTAIGANKVVSVSLNGNTQTASGTTDPNGFYTLKNIFVPMTGGTLVNLFLNNKGGAVGATVTLGSGSSMTGMSLYQNRLLVRSDSGSAAMTNAFLGAASNGNSDLSAIYTVTSGNLSVKLGKALTILTGKTFTPGGNVSVGSGFTNNGTLNLGSSTFTLSGSWTRTANGTLRAGTSTVVFNGSTAQLLTLAGSGAFNTLTINPGATLTAPSNGTVTLTGNFTNNGSFSANGSTILFNGTGNQTVTPGTGAFQNLTVSKTAGTLSVATNPLAVSGTLILSHGTLSTGAPGMTVTGLATLSGGTLTAGAGTQTFNGGLTVAGATLTGATGTVTVNGNLTLSGGTLTAPSTLNISGTFTHGNAATFSHNNGTVILTGGSQTLSGSTTFFTLQKSVTAAAMLTIADGTTQTITNALALNGSASGNLTVKGASTTWYIDSRLSRALAYLTVSNSHNSGTTEILCSNHCTDGGGNAGWDFESGDSGNAPAGINGGTGGGGGGGGSGLRPSVVTPTVTVSPETRTIKPLTPRERALARMQARLQKRGQMQKHSAVKRAGSSRPSLPGTVKTPVLPAPQTSPLPAPSASPSSGSATVTSHGLNVRTGPAAGARAQTQLDQGTKVQILETIGVWAKVRLPDGREGFVLSKYLGK